MLMLSLYLTPRVLEDLAMPIFFNDLPNHSHLSQGGKSLPSRIPSSDLIHPDFVGLPSPSFLFEGGGEHHLYYIHDS